MLPLFFSRRSLAIISLLLGFSLPALAAGPQPAQQPACTACGFEYEKRDMTSCPFHHGAICSLCCSLLLSVPSSVTMRITDSLASCTSRWMRLGTT